MRRNENILKTSELPNCTFIINFLKSNHVCNPLYDYHSKPASLQLALLSYRALPFCDHMTSSGITTITLSSS